MEEYQVVVNRVDYKLFYTLQKRKIHFLWRGRWKDITPVWQDSYEKAWLLQF